MLQGVVARGTARAIGALSPYVAGKTGTTEDAVDGWFIGFTNDVTIAVWVGYDNGDGKRRSLGSTETGARVALPIFEPIIEAIWSEHIAPKAPLSRPVAARRSAHLIDLPIDFASGQRVDARRLRRAFPARCRRPASTRRNTSSSRRADAYAVRAEPNADRSRRGRPMAAMAATGRWIYRRRPLIIPIRRRGPAQPPPPQPMARGLFRLGRRSAQPNAAARPGYFWGGRFN